MDSAQRYIPCLHLESETATTALLSTMHTLCTQLHASSLDSEIALPQLNHRRLYKEQKRREVEFKVCN